MVCDITCKMDRHCLVVFLVCVACFGMSSGLECLSCTGVRHMLDCKQLQRCGPHEDCYASQKVDVNGVFLWDLGCKDRLRCTQPQAIGKRASGDTVICDQCCNSTLCQETLCGNTKPTRRGPICYSCSSYYNAYDCYTLRICEAGEACYVTYNEYIDTYESDCLYGNQCSAMQLIGNLRGNKDSCPTCCYNNLCNKNCSSSA